VVTITTRPRQPAALDLGRHLEPGQLGHLDVGHQHVRALGGDRGQRGRAVARLGDDGEPRLGADERRERAEHQR
jgi:hypothetical protein